MSDALTPLRHAYGVEPPGPPPAPDDAGRAETDVLRQMRGLLESHAARRPRPSSESVASVAARAAEASWARSEEGPVPAGPLAPLAVALGLPLVGPPPARSVEGAVLAQSAEALGAAPRARPSAGAVEAVLRRADEATVTYQSSEPAVTDPALVPLAVALGLPAEAGASAESVEAVLLGQTLDALDAIPTHRPDAAAFEAVLSAAARASHGLQAVRSVYENEGAVEPAPGTPAWVEAELLRQSRQAVERALSARPQPRPSSESVASVAARAAEASWARSEEGPVPAGPLAPLAVALGLPLVGPPPARSVEGAVLAQSAEALGAAPRARPSAGAVEAVLRRADEAARPRRRANDRLAARTVRRRTSVGVWAGGVSLVAAVLIAVFMLPLTPDVGPTVERLAVASEDRPAAPPAAPAEAETSSPEAPPLAAPAVAAVAADAPELVAAAEQRVTREAPVRETITRQATTPAPPPPTGTEWTSRTDLATAAVAISELERAMAGLEWDAPEEAFGMPSVGPTSAFRPEIRAVREGTAPAPARAVVRSDSSRVQR